MSASSSAGGGWRQPILSLFTPEAAAAFRLTIVSDPDQLLAEQTILEEIERRGFDLIPFDDAIAFRYAYESQYIRHWDHDRPTAMVVLLRTELDDPDTLPYDLLSSARRNDRVFRFSVAEIFPALAPSVLAQVDRRHFDAVAEAVSAEGVTGLGERATKDFLLRHVFGWTPELIKTPADLIGRLLRRHYRNQRLPETLDERLVDRLRELGRFPGWPLERIVPDRQAFFAFLQERWPLFVQRRVEHEGRLREARPQYDLEFSGPADLPFDDEDVRVYLDNLFIEGLLAPTNAIPKSAVVGTWLESGVAGDDREEDGRLRFERLSESIATSIPQESANYREWIEFAQRWAEWSALRAELDVDDAVFEEAEALWARVDERFGIWMQSHFASLNNLAYLPSPAMAHHAVRFIAHGWQPGRDGRRVALIVLDGLAWGQWIPLRQSLASSGLKLTIEETGIFAWVPTITPVSRQAIFAGEAPFYFGKSIRTTSKDEAHWRRFWDARGIRGAAVQFVAPKSQEPETAFMERLLMAAENPVCVALGAVIPTIDAMAHGTVTGIRGLHAHVTHWANDGHFLKVVDALVDRDFTVYVTSDHGNVECTGVGKPNIGVLADERGERVHVFEDEGIRKTVHEQYPGSVIWPPIGLPDGYLPLLTTGRNAFASKDKRTISHGGISIDEVVVPFITIEGAV